MAFLVYNSYIYKILKTYNILDKNPDTIKMILEQEDYIGVRIYDGLNAETGKENRVLVGIDFEGEEMVNGSIANLLIPCREKMLK